MIIVAFAFAYSFFRNRATDYDELVLANPVYRYLHGAKMSYRTIFRISYNHTQALRSEKIVIDADKNPKNRLMIWGNNSRPETTDLEIRNVLVRKVREDKTQSQHTNLLYQHFPLLVN